jgi:hypothetical protein
MHSIFCFGIAQFFTRPLFEGHRYNARIRTKLGEIDVMLIVWIIGPNIFRQCIPSFGSGAGQIYTESVWR